jgi:CubicO group peptidase (beta-lactamase class C family)
MRLGRVMKSLRDCRALSFRGYGLPMVVFLVGTAFLCLACPGIQAGESRQGAATNHFGNDRTCPTAGDAEITDVLVRVWQKHRLPAICAAVVTSKGLAAVGVVGVRKHGTDIPASLDDQWHLGSETKTMTATLLARLVEQNQLKWDTTVSDVFPEMAGQFHPAMKGVTVTQLLVHRAGLPANLDLSRYSGTNVVQERRRAVQAELAKKPEHPPGSRYHYSNLGYIIVGAMIEKITGQTWEQAMVETIFAPLEMTSAGFGGTGTPGQIDQPWGHQSNGQPVSANGPAVDNPPVMGPAGRVHCSIQDWAKLVADQLRGARGQSALLNSSTYKTLHTPPLGGEYALGWLVVERDWGGGTVLHHTGDNTMNYANAWLAPKRDFAILVCLNQGGDKAFQASDEAISMLIERRSSDEPSAR